MIPGRPEAEPARPQLPPLDGAVGEWSVTMAASGGTPLLLPLLRAAAVVAARHERNTGGCTRGAGPPPLALPAPKFST